VGPYPAAAALRRRAARMEANGQVFPDNNDDDNDTAREETRRGTRQSQQQERRHSRSSQPKLSSLYCLVSLCLALLAIITSSSSSSSHQTMTDGNNKNLVEESINVESAKTAQQQQQEGDFFKSWHALFFSDKEQERPTSTPSSNSRSVPPLFRWMLPPVKEQERQSIQHQHHKTKNPLVYIMTNMLDPSLIHPQPSTLTDIIDKILTSTLRILAIANLLLALTWLLHSSVANLFLGPNAYQILGQDYTNRQTWADGRERLGGFLVFKLLLISAVVAPDTLDLLILLSWYTLLTFLRSLAHLCAATTAHTSQSGLAPRGGVLRLLLVVLMSDLLAAAFCVGLFHGAGWGMVLLLTCDCALLLVDVIGHVLQHVSQVLEEKHSTTIRELEERQVDIHSVLHTRREEEEDDDVAMVNRIDELRQESRQLDRRMELLETSHARRVGILDAIIFTLQLLSYALTVTHFLHIWSLHGLQFTLIDGVLALHLHSALSAAGKKIAERRNLNRIARDLDGLFEDASEVDMRKAGDVCCICLVTMTTGNVKRVGCGHLYHTHCLREVVERARSIEAAKCPLCRASVLDGRHFDSGGGGAAATVQDIVNADAAGNAEGGQQARAVGGGDVVVAPAAAAAANAPPPLGEHALFRFSTENILPAWLPLPAFSFEVVRRPPVAVEAAAAAADAAQQQQEAGDRNNAPRPSFFRRLLIMAGAIPMSAEETAMYLDQLVDMFPQYDRADLLRELRMRGSSEAVVEAVLMGVFSGVPRGGNLVEEQHDRLLPRLRRNEMVDALEDDTQ